MDDLHKQSLTWLKKLTTTAAVKAKLAGCQQSITDHGNIHRRMQAWVFGAY
jgi:hypothetical protein